MGYLVAFMIYMFDVLQTVEFFSTIVVVVCTCGFVGIGLIMAVALSDGATTDEDKQSMKRFFLSLTPKWLRWLYGLCIFLVLAIPSEKTMLYMVGGFAGVTGVQAVLESDSGRKLIDTGDMSIDLLNTWMESKKRELQDEPVPEPEAN